MYGRDAPGSRGRPAFFQRGALDSYRDHFTGKRVIRLEGSRLPQIALINKIGQRNSIRKVELLQEYGKSRVAVQALQ